MIEVKEGVFATEASLKEAREAYAKPYKPSLWSKFYRKMVEIDAKPTEKEMFRMYREFVKEHEKINTEDT